MPFFGRFLMFFEVFSILTAWSQLLTLHPNSTNFGGNFEISCRSGSVLIKNLVFSIEFEIYRKILSVNALCEVYLEKIVKTLGQSFF